VGRFHDLSLARLFDGVGAILRRHHRLKLKLLTGDERHQLIAGLLRLQAAGGDLALRDEIGEQGAVGPDVLDDLGLNAHRLTIALQGRLEPGARAGRSGRC